MNADRTAIQSTDPIAFEVFHSSLIATAEEMSEAVRRSSYSPIIREMLDYSCAVFDLDGELLAQAENIPALLGSMTFALPHLLQRFPAAEMQPGDAYIVNDPYLGASHTPDILIYTPVFLAEEPIAFCGAIAHHVDVGGKNPGTEGFDNASIFEEGLRMPPLRLIEAGRTVDALQEVIRANVRDPQGTLGDIRAQIAACRYGERRIAALASRHGVDGLRELGAAVKDYSERRTRADLEALPDGFAHASGFLDDDGAGGPPVEIRVEVTIEGSEVRVDFEGTSAQRPGGMNVPLASTHAAAWYAVKSVIDPSTPQNHGSFRSISLAIPEGTVLNPRFPAAVSMRHHTAQRTADTILRAFAELVPERAAAGSFVGFSGIAVENHHPRSGELTVLLDCLGGGMGGHRYGDGLDAVDTHLANVGMMPAEICEVEYPVRVLATELRPGSAGGGTTRGGLGIRRVYEFLAEEQLLVAYTEQGNPDFSPWGLDGGEPGLPARIELVPRDAPARAIAKEVLTVRPGDRLIVETGGGGGFGKLA